MNNPCYDKKTKTDCPRRHSSCALDCPEWAKYCEERGKEYKRRLINTEKDFLIGKAMDGRINKSLNAAIATRTRGFK